MDIKNLRILGEVIHDAMIDFTLKEGGWSSTLAGGCAVGAWFLHQEAKKKLDLNVEFHCNGGHAWNEFNGHIFDITATQYGVYDKVFIVSKFDLISVDNSWWYRGEYIGSVRYLIDRVNSNWPIKQQPANYKIKWIDKHKAKVIFKDRRQ